MQNEHGLIEKGNLLMWVETHNEISADYIFAGEDLIIPIKIE